MKLKAKLIIDCLSARRGSALAPLGFRSGAPRSTTVGRSMEPLPHPTSPDPPEPGDRRDYLPKRLGKFVRDATDLSVREVEAAWRAGRVSVRESPGAPCARSLATHVFPGDVVHLDGVRLRSGKPTYLGLLHKPAGVTSSSREPGARLDLRPWLALAPRGSFAVGRLDRETTGLLLLTNDGDLANAVLQPTHKAIKHYRLTLATQLERDDPRLLALAAPCERYRGARRVTLLETQPRRSLVDLFLQEGKKRQIRRMCYALGLRLVHLHRLAIGPIELGSLPLGALRAATGAERGALWHAVGGRAAAEQAQLAALFREAADARADGRPDARLERWLQAYC